MEPQLAFRDVTTSFGGATVLSGINLSITTGETVVIMVPSGSGKSTLLHCMSGVLRPSAGAVLFGGTDFAALNDAKRSALRLHKFSFVFQGGQLLPELTALENIALPAMLNGVSRGTSQQRARGLLEQLGLVKLVNRRPANMSGGQAQRVAVARALVIEPDIVFADEPTGALDPAIGHEMMQLLTSIMAGRGLSMPQSS